MEKKLIAKRLLQSRVVVVNVGLDIFLDVLRKKNILNVHVDWKPPARGNPELINALAKLSKKDER
jgi:FdrA protein